jgi:hypothetical protein
MQQSLADLHLLKMMCLLSVCMKLLENHTIFFHELFITVNIFAFWLKLNKNDGSLHMKIYKRFRAHGNVIHMHLLNIYRNEIYFEEEP